MIEVVTYRAHQFDGVRELWEEAFPDDPPWNRAEAAIPAKLAIQPDLFLVAVQGERVVGSVMAGYDGHRGWLYAAAVLKGHQRKGVASRLVAEAERRLRALGCEKVNLQVRAANQQVVGFYCGLGYQVEERISMGRRL